MSFLAATETERERLINDVRTGLRKKDEERNRERERGKKQDWRGR